MGFFSSGNDLSPDEHDHEHRRQGHGEKGGEEHGKGLGEGQGLEEPSLLGLQGEDGQEGDGDDQEGEKERPPHLLGRLDQELGRGRWASPAFSHSSSRVWAFSTMMMAASTMAPMAMAIPPRDMMFDPRLM